MWIIFRQQDGYDFYITNLVSVLADLNCKNKKFKVENDFVTAQITRRRIPSKQKLSYVI